jgi:hypothetical protein
MMKREIERGGISEAKIHADRTLQTTFIRRLFSIMVSVEDLRIISPLALIMHFSYKQLNYCTRVFRFEYTRLRLNDNERNYKLLGVMEEQKMLSRMTSNHQLRTCALTTLCMSVSVPHFITNRVYGKEESTKQASL